MLQSVETYTSMNIIASVIRSHGVNYSTASSLVNAAANQIAPKRTEFTGEEVEKIINIVRRSHPIVIAKESSQKS